MRARTSDSGLGHLRPVARKTPRGRRRHATARACATARRRGPRKSGTPPPIAVTSTPSTRNGCAASSMTPRLTNWSAIPRNSATDTDLHRPQDTTDWRSEGCGPAVQGDRRRLEELPSGRRLHVGPQVVARRHAVEQLAVGVHLHLRHTLPAAMIQRCAARSSRTRGRLPAGGSPPRSKSSAPATSTSPSRRARCGGVPPGSIPAPVRSPGARRQTPPGADRAPGSRRWRAGPVHAAGPRGPRAGVPAAARSAGCVSRRLVVRRPAPAGRPRSRAPTASRWGLQLGDGRRRRALGAHRSRRRRNAEHREHRPRHEGSKRRGSRKSSRHVLVLRSVARMVNRAGVDYRVTPDLLEARCPSRCLFVSTFSWPALSWCRPPRVRRGPPCPRARRCCLRKSSPKWLASPSRILAARWAGPVPATANGRRGWALPRRGRCR